MARAEIGEIVASRSGRPISGASVQVNKRAGGTATVYSAETGTTTVANPLTTDAYGRIEGWLAEGSFDLVVTANGSSYTQRFEAIKGGATGSSTFTVTDGAYGATGNGVTDDTAAIQAAITACAAAGGGVVYVPPGTFAISATLTIPNKVTLQGAGHGAELNAAVNIPWNPVSSIKWIGALNGKMVTVSSPPARIGIRDIGFDGNTLAAYALYLDRPQASVFENIGIQNCLTDLIYLFTSSVSLHANAQHNRFTSIWMFTGLSNTGSGLHLAGTGTANACINSFYQLEMSFANDGIVLDDCDNNTFTDVFLFRNIGTGSAVKFNADARANYFYHLEAGLAPIVAAAPSSPGFANAIYILDLSNSGSLPTIDANAILNVTTEGFTPAEWRIKQINLQSGGATLFSPSATDLNTNARFLATGNIAAKNGAATQVYMGDVVGGSQPGIIFHSSQDASIYRSTTATLRTDATFHHTAALRQSLTALTYSGTIATNASLGNLFAIIATNGTAFTISTPTNPLSGQVITYDIKNSSGGAHGVITWGAGFLNGGAGTVGTGAFAGIANTKRRTISFYYDGTNWIETNRAAADI